jgi:hypothetical protein
MSRRRCCGTTEEHPPLGNCTNKPTGFDAREYRLNLPELRPLVLGRVIPGDPVDIKDQGIFAGNASHPGWGISYCDYHTDPYFYYQKQQSSIGCNSSSNFWHYVEGPATQYMNSFGMIFDGADLVNIGGGAYPGATMTKNFGTSNTTPNAQWTLRVYMEKCRPNSCGDFPYPNRTFLQLLFKTRTRFQVRRCEPGGPISDLFLNTEWEAQYWTDAWTSSDGIGDTFYLKSFVHVSPIYFPCDSTENFWETSPCPQSFEKGTLSNYPINIVPMEITMDRLS